LGWAWERFGEQLAASSSFQTQSIPLLHIISTICPRVPIYFLDTGFHFPETLGFRVAVARRFRLTVIDLRCDLGHAGFVERFGQMYSHDPDRCCYVNKVEPMRRALGAHSAWVTGIRRDQTESRSAVPVISVGGDGSYKIAPMAAWTAADIAQYIDANDLPAHPLAARGFRSIGCQPCTRAVRPDDPDRDGRWHGTEKTECGLHAGYWEPKPGANR
jgi:phosphoadenosine phosphosulfate reductase